MRRILVKSSFEKAYKRLTDSEKDIVDDALYRFERYLLTGGAGLGLGIKHLASRTYEFRAGLSLRVVYILEEDSVILALLGRHDEIKRYLKEH